MDLIDSVPVFPGCITASVSVEFASACNDFALLCQVRDYFRPAVAEAIKNYHSLCLIINGDSRRGHEN